MKRSFFFLSVMLLSVFFSSYAASPTIGYVSNDNATFSAVIRGSLGAYGGDTEGGLAVGGNFTVYNSYSVSDRLPQSNGARDDLIVGGKFNNISSNWQIFSGNAVCGSFEGVMPSFGGNGNSLIYDSGRYDFSAAFSYFSAFSDQLAALENNGTLIDNGYGGLTFVGTHPDLNVFTLTSSSLKSWGATFAINVPPTSIVVINVPDGSFSIPGGSFSSDLRNRLIMNFPNASSVSFKYFMMLGTVLAPHANFSIEGGSINGHAIIGGNASQKGGGEFHNYPFTGKIVLPSGSIGDFVFADENENGIQDTGENGVVGVEVQLLNSDMDVIETTSTNSSGEYLFGNLWSGTFYVKFVLPENFQFTVKDSGSDDAKDSDADQSSGMTGAIVLATSNSTDETVDAGLTADGGALDVELSAFTAYVQKDGVHIEWQSSMESNHAGFYVWRRVGNADFERISENLIININFAATSGNYSFIDPERFAETAYKLEMLSITGESEFSDEIVVQAAASVNSGAAIAEFKLCKAYPNPFNPTTTIAYELPETTHANLIVFDALGRQVAELVNEIQAAGSYQVTWNAADSDQMLTSGIYFYRLQAGKGYSMTQRMMLVK